jgi:hypothetical protein
VVCGGGLGLNKLIHKLVVGGGLGLNKQIWKLVGGGLGLNKLIRKLVVWVCSLASEAQHPGHRSLKTYLLWRAPRPQERWLRFQVTRQTFRVWLPALLPLALKQATI